MRLLVAVILLLSGLSYADDPTGGYLDGKNPDTEDALAKSDVELNGVYGKLIKKLGANESAEKLKIAQRAWIPFRDGECEMFGSLFAGGASGKRARSAKRECLVKLTSERTEVLKKILPWK